MTTDNSHYECDKKFEEEPNSVIKLVFDQFAITHIFKNLINKTKWKATNQLNDAIVLFFFLFCLFYGLHLVKLELSLAVITLIILLIFIFVEFVGANIPIISRLFFAEEKADFFIKNIESYTTPYVERNLSLLTFSPKNIDTLLSIIQSEKNRIHPYISDQILLYNPLSTNNLDRIFSNELLCAHFRRDLIIDLLIKYNNQLSSQNIENVFTAFNHDEQVIKILIATQIDSESLITQKGTSSNISIFFEKFQKNIDTKTKISTLIKRIQTNVVPYRVAVLLISFPILFIGSVFYIDSFHWLKSTDMSFMMVVLSGLSMLIVTFIGKPIVDKIIYSWIDRSKKELLETL